MKDRLTLLLVSVLCSGVSYAQAPEQKDSIDVGYISSKAALSLI